MVESVLCSHDGVAVISFLVKVLVADLGSGYRVPMSKLLPPTQDPPHSILTQIHISRFFM